MNKLPRIILIVLLIPQLAACSHRDKAFATNSSAWNVGLANKIANEAAGTEYISTYYTGSASFICIVRKIKNDFVTISVRKYARKNNSFVLESEEQLASAPVSKVIDVVELWESMAEYGSLDYDDAVSEGDYDTMHFMVGSHRMAGGYRLTDLYGVGSDLALNTLYDSEDVSQIGPLWVHAANAKTIARELAWRAADMTLIRRSIINRRDHGGVESKTHLTP